MHNYWKVNELLLQGPNISLLQMNKIIITLSEFKSFMYAQMELEF